MDRKGLEETFTEGQQMGIKNYLDYKSNPNFANTTLLEQAGVDDYNKFISEKVDPVFPLGMNYEDWKKKAAAIDA